MQILSYLHTPLRMVKRRYSAKPIPHLWGDPEQICHQIIKSCWNDKEKYFMVSSGHFKEFYVRDFCMCVDGLLYLGYHKEVVLTLAYALTRFHAFNKITTTINDAGIPVNYFAYPSDSLPFILRTIRTLHQKLDEKQKNAFEELIFKYRQFLEQQVQVYLSEVFDYQTGLVSEYKKLSTTKDHENVKSSTYSNAMVGMLSLELDALGWVNPIRDVPVGKHIVADRWNGSFFSVGAKNDASVHGDANVFPFYCGIVKNKEYLKKVITSIQHAKLDTPFPLKYTQNLSLKNRFAVSILSPNYEGNTIWAHLGMCYLYVVDQYDQTLVKQYLESYLKTLKQFGNFLEVYTPDGKKPYTSSLYVSDQSILWVAMFLHLAKKNNVL